jgi:hypothetical protein
VSKPKTEQHRLTHRGRHFHFVSYEAERSGAADVLPAPGPAWYLMSCGKRWHVMPWEPDQEPERLDHQFAEWLDTHVFA